MPYVRDIDPRPEVQHAPCLHLLSKGMYVTGQVVPDRQRDGMGDGYCWCNLTQRALGPDQQVVDRRECGPARSCYQART